MGRTARKLITLAVAAGALFASAPNAHAGLLAKSVDNCSWPQVEKPFSRFGDNANYVLAPGGSVEDGTTGWSSVRGASAVDGNETYYARSTSDRRSLALPAGSSATTGVMCVGLEHPTIRFFARESGTLLQTTTSTLVVSVVYEDGLGNVLSLPIGTVLGSSSWRPTARFVNTASLLPLLPGNYTPVAFKFTPVGKASWRIDDIYVDPRRFS